jgi:hypothetical protein
VPAMSSCLLEPLRAEFCALPAVSGPRPTRHTAGLSPPRISDRVVFKHEAATSVTITRHDNPGCDPGHARIRASPPPGAAGSGDRCGTSARRNQRQSETLRNRHATTGARIAAVGYRRPLGANHRAGGAGTEVLRGSGRVGWLASSNGGHRRANLPHSHVQVSVGRG